MQINHAVIFYSLVRRRADERNKNITSARKPNPRPTNERCYADLGHGPSAVPRAGVVSLHSKVHCGPTTTRTDSQRTHRRRTRVASAQ